MNKAEQLAEQLFQERQAKQIALARRIYAQQQYWVSPSAIRDCLSTEEDRKSITYLLDVLEKLFGAETFKDLKR